MHNAPTRAGFASLNRLPRINRVPLHRNWYPSPILRLHLPASLRGRAKQIAETPYYESAHAHWVIPSYPSLTRAGTRRRLGCGTHGTWSRVQAFEQLSRFALALSSDCVSKGWRVVPRRMQRGRANAISGANELQSSGKSCSRPRPHRSLRSRMP